MDGNSPEEEKPTVLIGESDVGLAEQFVAWLPDSYDVRVAYNCDGAFGELDATIDAAVLDRQLSDGSGDDLVTTIREWELDCGVALVTAVRPDADIGTVEVDEYLVKPVGREEIRSTVSRLLRLSEYEQMAREFFTVTSKKAFLETHVPASDLEQMDEYERLVARADQLEAKLADLASQFTPSQLDAVGSQLTTKLHETFANTTE